MDTYTRTGGGNEAAAVYTIRKAGRREVGAVRDLIDGAADWLRRAKPETDQWNRPWPNLKKRNERIRGGVVNGDTWLLFHGTEAVGTVTIKVTGHPELWTSEERLTKAVYLHRLVIRRDGRYMGSGLGTELINWAGRKGTDLLPGAKAIRIDVWSDNHGLHQYYKERGFESVAQRTTSDGTPSGALFQKPMDLVLSEPVPRIREEFVPKP